MQNRATVSTALLIAYYIVISQVLYAQETTIRGRVVDQNLQPIKYVSIGIPNSVIGTVSNDAGEFSVTFNHDSMELSDSLKFSIIGYYSKGLSISKHNGFKTGIDTALVIVLNEKLIQLEEVILAPQQKTRSYGTHHKSLLNLQVNFVVSDRSNQNLGSEIGRRFSVSKKNTRIKALTFFLSQNNFDSVKFRVNVYSIKRGKPDNNLLNKNIYLSVKGKKKGWIEIDLSEYNILVSESIIISLEWISKSNRGNALSLPVVMPTLNAHFYKYGSQNTWKRFNGMSTYMELKTD